MIIRRRLGCFLLFSLLSAAAVSAQQSTPPAQSNGGRIYLDVVVTDKSGRPVPGLQQQDFTLLDNKAPQTITSFESFTGRQAAAEVMLVIDAVNAPYDSVSYQRAQIDKFFHSKEGDLAYPMSLVVFTDEGTKILGGFSSDGNAMKAALDQEDISLRNLPHSTGFYGAAERWQLSLQALQRLIAQEAPFRGRKLLVWLSPGWPLLSGPSVQFDSKQEEQIFADVVRFSTELLRSGVTVYSVDPAGPTGSIGADSYYREYLKGVTKPSQVNVGNLALPVLAVQSGGLAFSATNGIADRLRQCLDDVAPYYEISFDPQPAKTTEEYHRLDVELATHGLTARTRQGYYTQP